MNNLKCLSILIVAYLTVAVAANEKEILVRVRPITRKQYESVMKINNGKPTMPEDPSISSAITGLTGSATELLPSSDSTDNQNSKSSDVLGNYPLCTFTAVNGREGATASNLNIEQITNSLAQSSESTNNLPIMNCILVLDDSEEKPLTEQPEEPKEPKNPEELEESEVPTSKPTMKNPPTGIRFYPSALIDQKLQSILKLSTTTTTTTKKPKKKPKQMTSIP